MRVHSLALAALLVPGMVLAEPFPAPGEWRGEGRIIRDDGASARLRCQMTGQSSDARRWQAEITCASVEGRFEGAWTLEMDASDRITGTGFLRSETQENYTISGNVAGDYLVFDVGGDVRIQLLVAPDAVEMSFAQIGTGIDAPGGGIVRFRR